MSTVKLGALQKAFHDGGGDMVREMLEQAHRDGMLFIAAMRMNDRHPIAVRERVWGDHPAWRLDLGRKGVYWEGGFDYAIDAVRAEIVTFVGQMLDHYDFDGVELDWMRWVHVFAPGTQEEHPPRLTDFHRQVRAALDTAGRRRGRRLLLGARVPMVLETCREFGFDVAAWVGDGLLDYIVPSHFGNTDFNAPVEGYRALTEGSACRVYPSLQGHLWVGPTRLERYDPMHYFGAAHNAFAAGADGVQVYNYQFRTFEEVASRVSDLAPLADPARLWGRERAYAYWRNRGEVVGAGESAMAYDVIRLDRTAAEVAGSFTFRLGDDLASDGQTASMTFNVVGLDAGEQLDVRLNGTRVDDASLNRVPIWDGRARADGREGEPEPYDRFRLVLSAPPVRFGDNVLTVGLRSPRSDGGVVVVDDVAVRVEVCGMRGREPGTED